MLNNFIKSILRNLWKQRLYTLINVAGLICGVTVSILVYLYVQRELRFDQDFKNADRLYRVLRKADLNGNKYLIGVTSAPFAEALQTDFPQDIEQTLRVSTEGDWVRYEDKVFYENNFCLTDSNFFDIFPYELLVGDKATALSLPNNVIVTEQMAHKYFGDDDPIGKVLLVADTIDLVVSGVIDTKSTPTHLNFDFLGNIQLSYTAPWFFDWWNNGLQTYVIAKDNANIGAMSSQLPAFMDKYFGKDFAANKNRIDLELQPLDEVYFEKQVRYDWIAHGNKETVYVFSAVAVFIILIAIINFINLSTAKSISRAKEVGVKRALGSSRAQLIAQFMLESCLITGVALGLSLMLAEIVIPVLNNLLGLQLALAITPSLMLSLFIFFVLLSLLAGLYPAFILSGFKPVSVLKSHVKSSKEGALFRKSLVVFQFGISAFLIVATLVAGRQLKFLNQKSLGFDKENVVLIHANNDDIYNQRDAFKRLLEQVPGVRHVSKIVGEPGGFHDTMALQVEGLDEMPRMRTAFVDEDYAETFDIPLAAGRDFSVKYPADMIHSIIINEAGAREIGWSPEEAIGKRVSIRMRDTVDREVIGVFRDFHFASLKTSIEPMVISPAATWVSQFAVRIDGNNYSNTIAGIEKAWKSIVPQYPFAFEFLDDRLDGLYQGEQLQSRLFEIFAAISILIACLGIVGLATFTASQRNREIGIRKVLGATVGQLTYMVMREFLILVLVATLIACPLGWWSTEKWMSEFAYRINVDPSLFLVVPLITLGIAVLSVIYQALRVATNNPASVLKEE